ncbi:MAG TPA: hypothetical protein VNG93_03590 [Candidatus Dormibacteraeota bacterium]|nr:hypothetical protein [Candidatus Dormibacteraeota bacterium]
MSEKEHGYESNALHQTAVAEVLKSPTTHVPRLVTSRAGRHKVHGAGPVGQFNNRVALMVTKGVGTMWAAYLFAALTFISLPAAIASRSPIIIVAWIAQTFLQLVLLPIIIVGQNVISASQDARAEADHETLTALHTMNVRQLQMLEQQGQILDLLKGKSS